MKVILLHEVPNVGLEGDVVNVADGYARNYLFPKGLAEPATPKRVKEVEGLKVRRQKKEEKTLGEAQVTASKLENTILEIRTRAGEGGRLFGSVTNADVARLLRERGFSIDKKKIEPAEPIKSLGPHAVQVKLYKDVTVTITVQVIGE